MSDRYKYDSDSKAVVRLLPNDGRTICLCIDDILSCV